MEKQVLSIEQMEELIELGIDTSKASIWWIKSIEDSFEPELTLYTQLKHVHHLIGDVIVKGYELIPTFTFQDILDMLPQGFYLEKGTTSLDKKAFLQINKTAGGGYNIAYEQSWDENGNLKIKMHGRQLNESLLEAAFNMLKWCKQNNHI